MIIMIIIMIINWSKKGIFYLLCFLACSVLHCTSDITYSCHLEVLFYLEVFQSCSDGLRVAYKEEGRGGNREVRAVEEKHWKRGRKRES